MPLSLLSQHRTRSTATALSAAENSPRPSQWALGTGLLLTTDPDPKSDLMSRAISTLCPTPTWPTQGPCPKSWLSSPAGWHRGAKKGTCRLKELPSSTLRVVRGLLCKHFLPSPRKFCGQANGQQRVRQKDRPKTGGNRQVEEWESGGEADGQTGTQITGQVNRGVKTD